MSSLFGDDDDLFGDDLFGDGLFGDGHSPEDPGLATLTFPAAPFGGLTLPEIPGATPCPAMPETTVGTPAQSQLQEDPTEVELLALLEPLTSTAELPGAGESNLAGLGPAAPVDATPSAIDFMKVSDVPFLLCSTAQTRDALFLPRRLDQVEDRTITDLLSLCTDTSVHTLTERLGLSRSKGPEMRKEAVACLAKSDFGFLLEGRDGNNRKEAVDKYKSQLWAATGYLLEAEGLGRRWFDGRKTTMLKWQQDSTLIAINFFSLLHKAIRLNRQNLRGRDFRQLHKNLARVAGSLNPTLGAPPETPTQASTDHSVEPPGGSQKTIDASAGATRVDTSLELPGNFPENTDNAADPSGDSTAQSIGDPVESMGESTENIGDSSDTFGADHETTDNFVENTDGPIEPVGNSAQSMSEPVKPFSMHDLVEPFEDSIQSIDGAGDTSGIDYETIDNFLKACHYSNITMDVDDFLGAPDDHPPLQAENLEGLVDTSISFDSDPSSPHDTPTNVESGSPFDASFTSDESATPYDISITSLVSTATSMSSASSATEEQPPATAPNQSYQLRLGSFVDAVSSKMNRQYQAVNGVPKHSFVPATAKISYHIHVFSRTTGLLCEESLQFTHQDMPYGTGITQLKTMLETAGHFPSFQVFTPKGRRDIESQSTWDEAILDIYNGRDVGEIPVIVHMFV